MEQFTKVQQKDIKVLISFIRVYCAAKHGERRPRSLPADLAPLFPKGVELCDDCAALLHHALEKRRKCPLDPKPSCKKCHIHCYSREHRAKIREVMAFSGRRMILRGRLDYLWHYLF